MIDRNEAVRAHALLEESLIKIDEIYAKLHPLFRSNVIYSLFLAKAAMRETLVEHLRGHPRVMPEDTEEDNVPGDLPPVKQTEISEEDMCSQMQAILGDGQEAHRRVVTARSVLTKKFNALLMRDILPNKRADFIAEVKAELADHSSTDL